MKIFRILRAWLYVLLRIDRKIAKKRYLICTGCEHSKLARFQKANLEWLKCGICDCPIKSKVQDFKGSCPDGRW